MKTKIYISLILVQCTLALSFVSQAQFPEFTIPEFTIIDTGAIYTSTGHHVASGWFDMDNDNDMDLIITNSSGMGYTNHPNLLYKNELNGNFILAPNNPWDWHSPQETNLWQGVNGVNKPCQPGYRLPTEAELNTERLSWGSNNSAGAFASPLKLPVAGSRGYGGGLLNGVGSYGSYWSSTVGGITSRALFFDSNGACMDGNTRARGNSVRCLKDN